MSTSITSPSRTPLTVRGTQPTPTWSLVLSTSNCMRQQCLWTRGHLVGSTCRLSIDWWFGELGLPSHLPLLTIICGATVIAFVLFKMPAALCFSAIRDKQHLYFRNCPKPSHVINKAIISTQLMTYKHGSFRLEPHRGSESTETINPWNTVCVAAKLVF